MFELRDTVVADFRHYVESFLNIRDPEISAFLRQELDRGALWPDPLLQLNPLFETGGLVDELIDAGSLDPRCGTIFRRDKTEDKPAGKPLRLFKHQVQAIELAQKGSNYVLTTGTGSGKSMSYMLPIVDAVLKEGSGKGIRAVIVYPMNALANSQLGELDKYLGIGPNAGCVTYERYTGQEKQEDRDRVQKSPPDILLTNYVMLELMLTRPRERAIVRAMSSLRFIVLDELHTYRGRQGADIAMLMRRLRNVTGSQRLQAVGTSATMASEGTAAAKRQAVADVAAKIFGAPVNAAEVIGETLSAYSDEADVETDEFRKLLVVSLSAPTPTTHDEFRSHALTIWLERCVGLDYDDENQLKRAYPAAISGAGGVSSRLAEAAEVSGEEAMAALAGHLLAAAGLPPDPRTGARPFVFRLHQFLSPGLGIFASLAESPDRYLSLDGQKSDPANPERLLFPLCFCRNCGQHYYLITKVEGDGKPARIEPRQMFESHGDDTHKPGYIYLHPQEQEPIQLDQLIPDDWREDRNGRTRIRPHKKKYLPEHAYVSDGGELGSGHAAWFVPAPFSICMNTECGASFGAREGDITKLAVLGTQGRSTATTTLAISTVEYLRSTQIDARKILSFTDNRQDASLQAGHLNDFVQVGLLRASIFAAAHSAGSAGLAHDAITLAVEKHLDLKQEDYAQQAATLPTQINQRRVALRDVLGYHIYRDLRRGWRVNAPNLEQVGLLKIEYPDLPVICADPRNWDGTHWLLASSPPETREKVCKELLERMRRKLAIKVDYLDTDYQEGIKRRSSQLLKEPYALSDGEAYRLDSATYAWLGRGEATEERSDLFLTARSSFGIWLRQPSTFDKIGARVNDDDVEKIIGDMVHVLEDSGQISGEKIHGETSYRLNADVFLWLAAEPTHAGRRTHNAFFERLYRERARNLKGISAREHTAQVPSEQRQQREDDFKAGKLPIMFCSPTMELGVDIANLNVVNMRNVPPTPANYAQRSGRAGRSGQPAFVFTYATAGSPHDQYYFRRPELMVAGAVAPPRIDIANEDLVRAHVHAIWLAEADLDLGSSMAEKILNMSGDEPTLSLTEEVADRLNDIPTRARALERSQQVLAAIVDELKGVPWYTDRWLSDVMNQIPLAFDRACDRWRNLYSGARSQLKLQSRIMLDASISAYERGRAESLHDEARNQISALIESNSGSLSDFYTYRYLASEGFLPGYSFPRLPLSAYLPGHKSKSEYLSRPRFLAISEFGPGAVIYHEGSRYLVDRILIPADSRRDTGQIETSEAKLCGKCGYLHSGIEAQTADICSHCSEPLTADNMLRSLFRMEAVNLRRRDQITCDEEERMRQGYEIRTALRFDGRPGEEQFTLAEIKDGEGAMLGTMTYALAATIWRINVGWNKRKNKDVLGYQLDSDKGRWISEEGANDLMSNELEDGARRVIRVSPFVEDRRNALIFQWASPLKVEEHASLQSALKNAIQAVFELEDSELAAEPLPSADKRNAILFYEAAEGGAGVLRRIVEEPGSLRKVAMKALDLCHFDPATLQDNGKSQRAKDLCSTACYDCLMSYGNQRDHRHLDRRVVKDLLAGLRDAAVESAVGPESRSKKLERLMAQCDSGLEKQWLKTLDALGLALPTYAQHLIADCGTRPDFAYVHGANKVAVYVDGPPHDYASRQLRDADKDLLLLTKGWLVHRFHHADDWMAIFKESPSVYGELT